MKRLIITALCATIFAFMLPIFTVGSSGEKKQEPPQNSEEKDKQLGSAQQVSSVSFDEKTSITLLKNGEVVTLNLGDYLVGVVAAEMPASFPQEALRAQAIAARTYTLYKLRAYEQGATPPESHQGAQLCDDFSHCKAYIDLEQAREKLWGSKAEEYEKIIRAAVDDTNGMVVTYQGEPVAAVFHSASSGKTENAVDVWGGDRPYLVSVDSPGEEECPKFYGEVSIKSSEFAAKFIEKHPEANFNDPPQGWFMDSNRSASGAIINVKVGGVRVRGSEVRSILGLNSTNFTLKASDDALVFSTKGYGHGVGMSQYGARELALEGKAYGDILKWYYQGTEITLKN